MNSLKTVLKECIWANVMYLLAEDWGETIQLYIKYKTNQPKILVKLPTDPLVSCSGLLLDCRWFLCVTWTNIQTGVMAHFNMTQESRQKPYFQ